MDWSSAAVIDIGSNSIKLLVARRTESGRLEGVLSRTVDARISTGISQASPHLSAESMQRGLAAVQELLATAAPLHPSRTSLVATSAVRGATNGADFRAQIRAATGHEVRILTGDEEASLIGDGIVCDPSLQHLRDFNLFDLGGGSLECLTFRDRRPNQAASFPLGCVRLMEKLAPDASKPFAAEHAKAVANLVRSTLDSNGWRWILPAGSPVVGTGGTVTTVRAIAAARADVPIEQFAPVVPVALLRETLDRLGGLPLDERKRVPGLPPRRADVFPTAMATLIAVAECGKFDAYHHSFYNLRWGVAAGLLGG